MNLNEMNNEILECARYGEDDDLRALLVAGADVNFADDSGNTSLHRAAANGEVGCIRVLKEFGALHVANKQGNLPIHWAAQNAKSESLRVLFDCFDVDVLVKNVAGRSTLTDAFESKEVAVIELCLSHSSASEERLLETNDKNAKIVEEDNENESGKESTAKVYNVEEHAVSHQMRFRSDVVVKIRELPITRADHPFGSESAPEDDTTGGY
jgi:ankyrin repeat protein